MHVLEIADPAADSERDADALRDFLDHADIDRAALGRGCDIVEHQLVAAAVAVGHRHLDRVAEVDIALELDALGDLAVPNVEAGDYALGQHLPSHLAKFSSSLSPIRPERSGWNCVAKRFALPTTDANRASAYSVSATTYAAIRWRGVVAVDEVELARVLDALEERVP